MNALLAFILVFLVIFVVPILVYALFTKFLSLEEPEKKAKFFLGVVIQKVGTTFGFLALFILALQVVDEKWLPYAFIWFGMFAITEIGQALMPNYSKKEAMAGIISEAIYFPLAAYIAHIIL